MCAPVAVAATGIGHVPFPDIDVQQRVDDVGLTVGAEQCQQRRRCAVGVPDGIVVVIVGQVGVLPTFLSSSRRILARLVDGHEHGVVESRIEHSPLLRCPLDLYLGKFLFPRGAKLPELFVEVVGRDVASCLCRTDIRDADFHLHGLTVCLAGRAERKPCPLSFFVGLSRKGHIALQTEIDGIGIAVVPSASHAGKTFHRPAVRHVQGSSHKLLTFTQIGLRIFAEEVGTVDEKGGNGGPV